MQAGRKTYQDSSEVDWAPLSRLVAEHKAPLPAIIRSVIVG